MAREPEKFERKKVRKRRKPMTPEQKAAAVERLAKARAKRAAANPPQYKNVHPDVLAIPEDGHLSFAKVRKWIKHNRELLKEERAAERANVKGARAKVKNLEGYVRDMERYLRDGDWISNFWGEEQQNLTKWRCVVPAYDDEGNIKRTHGVYYDDLGYRWGFEPEEEEGVLPL